MSEEEDQYEWDDDPDEPMPIESRSDADIERMLIYSLARVTEISTERNRRIQLKFSAAGQNTLDMIEEYQSVVKNNPLLKLSRGIFKG